MSWLRFCSSSFSLTSTLFVGVRRLLDVDVLAALERLEVAELIQPLDAELQRFGVEHAVFDQPQLAPDDVVARRRVAGEDDAVDEVLLPLPASASSRRRVGGSFEADATGSGAASDSGAFGSTGFSSSRGFSRDSR